MREMKLESHSQQNIRKFDSLMLLCGRRMVGGGERATLGIQRLSGKPLPNTTTFSQISMVQNVNYISYLTPIPSCFHPASQFISVIASKFSNNETGTQCRSRLWHGPTGEKSENRRYDNNDNGKRCPGNHSKPGRMDKSGEAEEEERGQGGLETRCAFAFFLS